MSATSLARRHSIAIVAYQDLHLFEFSCAYEIFGADRLGLGADWYGFRVCAVDGEQIRAQGGLTLNGSPDLELLCQADTILVPGWPVDRPLPPEIRDAMVRAHNRGARLASICSGAFALAQTGLLDGKNATTHWVYADLFSRRFPKINLQPDTLYVEAGSLITSAGSAAGIDMMLELVRRDHGSDICNRMARRLVAQPHRAGGQRQFVERLVPDVKDDRLRHTVEWIRSNAHRDLNNATMAMHAGMSSRSFFRKFRSHLGTSPQEFVLQERVAAARLLLERDAMPLIHVAETCGFGAMDTFRYHFRRIVGQSPAEYRRRFAYRS